MEMIKRLLILIVCLGAATTYAQKPQFDSCSSCRKGKIAALTPENLVEFYLLDADNVRALFELNGYTTEVQPGFCAHFFLPDGEGKVELIYKKCEQYFLVSQESGQQLDLLLEGIESKFMREVKGEKWYSIEGKNQKRYKLLAFKLQDKTTIKVLSF